MKSTDNSNLALEKIITFNDILSPLVLAIAKHMGIVNSKESCDVEALLLAKLVENVLEISNKYTSDHDITNEEMKWTITSNISKLVASNYKNKKDLLESSLASVKLEEKEQSENFSKEENFKSAIFETMSPIVNVIKRFDFAIDEEKIIAGTEKQIIAYANNLFSSVDKSSLGVNQFNNLYLKTIKNLSEIFSTCYYNTIDATLSVPKEKREGFIQKHMIDSSDSANKLLDSFYSRVSIISNISIALDVPLEQVKS
jgi:hypothetical protein